MSKLKILICSLLFVTSLFYGQTKNVSNVTQFLNELADSTFSSHSSDTSNPHDYQQLMDAVVKYNADFGVMFDGD